MAWAAFLKYLSQDKWQAVSLLKICLPLYVTRFDILGENAPLPDWPVVSLEEPPNRNKLGSVQCYLALELYEIGYTIVIA
jgi:hypothetical protein